jgi:hypothetical protein
MFYVAKAEIDFDVRTLTNNQNILEKDQEAVTAKGHTLNPIDPVPSGFWETIRWRPPKALIDDQETLEAVREVSRRSDQVNMMISSRERFRLGKSPGDHLYFETIGGFNSILLKFQGELLDELAKLKPALEQIEPKPKPSRAKRRLGGFWARQRQQLPGLGAPPRRSEERDEHRSSS